MRSACAPSGMRFTSSSASRREPQATSMRRGFSVTTHLMRGSRALPHRSSCRSPPRRSSGARASRRHSHDRLHDVRQAACRYRLLPHPPQRVGPRPRNDRSSYPDIVAHLDELLFADPSRAVPAQSAIALGVTPKVLLSHHVYSGFVPSRQVTRESCPCAFACSGPLSITTPLGMSDVTLLRDDARPRGIPTAAPLSAVAFAGAALPSQCPFLLLARRSRAGGRCCCAMPRASSPPPRSLPRVGIRHSHRISRSIPPSRRSPWPELPNLRRSA